MNKPNKIFREICIKLPRKLPKCHSLLKCLALALIILAVVLLDESKNGVNFYMDFSSAIIGFIGGVLTLVVCIMEYRAILWEKINEPSSEV